MMGIKEEVLKEIYEFERGNYIDYQFGLGSRTEELIKNMLIDSTLKKIKELIDNIECSALDNAIWFKNDLLNKLEEQVDDK